MGKILFQFLVLLSVFFATWFVLSRVDYVKNMHLEKMSAKTEKKIGDLIIKTIKENNKEIENDSLKIILNKIKDTICNANAINKDEIKIHLMQNEDINAFSLPDNHIIIYTTLVNNCDSVPELCGVIAHELAHIKLHHVMKKLGSELGITLLMSAASNGNSQVIGNIVKTLSSTAFERKMETEADATAIQYLQHAHINPRGLPGFLSKVSELKGSSVLQPEWISTHPDSKKRVDAIMAIISDSMQHYKPVLNDEEWQFLKNACEEN